MVKSLPAAGVARLAGDAATDALRDAILNGTYLPGDRLKEGDVAARLGISRTPIRRALTVLESEGLVDVAPHRGARVREYDAKELDDVYQLRAVLEGHAARRAAGNATSRDLEVLRESCERFERLHVRDDLKATVEENLFFHRAIIDVADSDRLRDMMRALMVMPLVYSGFSYFDQEQKRSSERYHRRILAALTARDGDEAERAMQEHDLGARDVLVTRFSPPSAAALR